MKRTVRVSNRNFLSNCSFKMHISILKLKDFKFVHHDEHLQVCPNIIILRSKDSLEENLCSANLMYGSDQPVFEHLECQAWYCQTWHYDRTPAAESKPHTKI